MTDAGTARCARPQLLSAGGDLAGRLAARRPPPSPSYTSRSPLSPPSTARRDRTIGPHGKPPGRQAARTHRSPGPAAAGAARPGSPPAGEPPGRLGPTWPPTGALRSPPLDPSRPVGGELPGRLGPDVAANRAPRSAGAVPPGSPPAGEPPGRLGPDVASNRGRAGAARGSFKAVAGNSRGAWGPTWPPTGPCRGPPRVPQGSRRGTPGAGRRARDGGHPR